MPEITTATIECDFCGKNLKEADASLGEIEGGRYLRVSEEQRPMRYILTTSIDPDMRHSVYCSGTCLAAYVRKGG